MQKYQDKRSEFKKNHTPGTISIQFKTLTTFSVYEFKIETHTLAYYLYFCMSY